MEGGRVERGVGRTRLARVVGPSRLWATEGKGWIVKRPVVALVGSLIASPARSEVLEFRCSAPFVDATGDMITHIILDTQSKYVRQTTSFANLKQPSLTLEFRDGVVSKFGGKGPNVRRFVRINDETVYYGVTLHNKEQGVWIELRTGAVLLHNGQRTQCALLPR
jgi:hypothetical protein